MTTEAATIKANFARQPKFVRWFFIASAVMATVVVLLLVFVPAPQPKVEAVAQAPQAVEPTPTAPPPAPVPHYLVKDQGRYGYDPALSAADKTAGLATTRIVMFAYAGMRHGAHQLISMDKVPVNGKIPPWTQTLEWEPGAPVVAQLTFRDKNFHEKTFLRAAPDSLVMAAMQDAQNGLLERFVLPVSGKPSLHIWCDEQGGCSGELAEPSKPK